MQMKKIFTLTLILIFFATVARKALLKIARIVPGKLFLINKSFCGCFTGPGGQVFYLPGISVFKTKKSVSVRTRIYRQRGSSKSLT